MMCRDGCNTTEFYAYKFWLDAGVIFDKLHCQKVKRTNEWHHLKCYKVPTWKYGYSKYYTAFGERVRDDYKDKDIILLCYTKEKPIAESSKVISKIHRKSIKMSKDILVSKIEKKLSYKEKLNKSLAETTA